MTKLISVRLYEGQIAKLDELSKRLDISRHQLILNMLDVGVDELRLGSKIGLFQLGILLRDIKFPEVKYKYCYGDEKPIPVKVDEKILSHIDKFAEKADLSRHQIMKNIIEVGIDQVEALMSLGFHHLAEFTDSLKNSFHKICDEGKKALNAVNEGGPNQ